MDALSKFRKITESWWLDSKYPILFKIMIQDHSLHTSTATPNIRVGKNRIEINPEWVNSIDDRMLEQHIIKEGMRILLGHPYSRKKPDPVRGYVASDITLSEYMTTQLELPNAKEMFNHLTIESMTHEMNKFKQMYENEVKFSYLTDDEFMDNYGKSREDMDKLYNNLPSLNAEDISKRHYEFYYSLLPKTEDVIKNLTQKYQDLYGDKPNNTQDNNQDNNTGNENSDHNGKLSLNDIAKNSELWDDDAFMKDIIQQEVNKAQIDDKHWGNLPGEFKKSVIANLVPKADYKKIIKSFKRTVVSSETKLTRNRLNRRHEFQMGRIYEYQTEIYGYADTSGSVSDESLRNAFGFMIRFLKYGAKKIIIKQWDTKLYDEEICIKKPKFNINTIGRGGTDITPVFKDIASKLKKNPRFTGAVIVTDCEFSYPNLTDDELRIIKHYKNKIVMVAENERQYNMAKNRFHNTISNLCFIIPQ